MSKLRQGVTTYLDLEVNCPACNSIATHAIESYNLIFVECETCKQGYLVHVHQGFMIRTFCERVDIQHGLTDKLSDLLPSFN